MPPKKKRKQPADTETISLEEAMEELTAIVGELESGQQPLDQALQNFERGMQLLRECSRQLENAAGRIEQLCRITEDGAVLEPFDGAATTDRSRDDDDSESLF